MGNIWLGEDPDTGSGDDDFTVFCRLISDMERVRCAGTNEPPFDIPVGAIRWAFNKNLSPCEAYAKLLKMAQEIEAEKSARSTAQGSSVANKLIPAEVRLIPMATPLSKVVLSPSDAFSPAQEMALCILASGGGRIRKQTAQALIRKGLAVETDAWPKLAFAPGVESQFIKWCEANR